MTFQPTAPSQPTRRRMPLAAKLTISALALLGAALALVVVYRSDRPSDLGRKDPAGAAACRGIRQWINGKAKDPDTGKPASSLIIAMSVAEVAKHSTTPAIRAAAGDNLMDSQEGRYVQAYGGPDEFRVADLRRIHAACISAGEKMPAYVEPVGA